MSIPVTVIRRATTTRFSKFWKTRSLATPARKPGSW